MSSLETTEMTVFSGYNITAFENGSVLNNSVLTWQQIVSEDVLQYVQITFVGLSLTVALIGIVGNVLSLVILCQVRMRTVINYYLIALAVSDILFLLHSCMFAIMSIMTHHDHRLGINLRNQLYSIFGAYGSVVSARITSILTLLICVERFVAVYIPMKLKAIHSSRNTVKIIVSVYLACFLLFVPLALKYESKTIQKGNKTVTILVKYFGIHLTFYTVYGTIMNIVFRFLPIFIQVILNFKIFQAIKKTWKLRRIMTNGSYQVNIQDQSRVTKMLWIVSCSFLGFIIPGAMSSIVSQVWPKYSRIGDERNLYQLVSLITYFLETLNSSTNFIIYMIMSKQFLSAFKNMFRRIKKKHRKFSDNLRLLLLRRHMESSSTEEDMIRKRIEVGLVDYKARFYD